MLMLRAFMSLERSVVLLFVGDDGAMEKLDEMNNDIVDAFHSYATMDDSVSDS